MTELPDVSDTKIMIKKQAVSEVVGRAEFGNHSGGVLYRALRPLICAPCGKEIGAGELFTRRLAFGQNRRIMPQCGECAPFTIKSGGGKAQTSPMIQSLMSSQPDKPSRTAPAPDSRSTGQPHEQEARDKIAEAFQQRLGPVLRRIRRVH